MHRRIFWVLWDYRQGGLWQLVRAESAAHIKAKYPKLRVFDAVPAILDADSISRITEAGIQELDAPPVGWLADLLPPSPRTISSPGEFKGLLTLIQSQLRAGTLRQRSANDPLVSQLDVSRLSLDGPWPDIIEAEFLDDRGQRYRLFVDPYHGSVGEWRMMTHDPR